MEEINYIAWFIPVAKFVAEQVAIYLIEKAINKYL